ncbi:MAG: 4-hydroxythreonine-4-phosphate dehydrogenase PdxA [Sphingobacteriaceae bacterium]|nr:4-hydroxythreonine-4-phosphate dehydrogenase PdxA [Cytophagaceae bacterium]
MSDQPQPPKPVIGITLGDYNGIGPEVILKALNGNQLTKVCTPIVYGSLRVLNRYRTMFDLKDWQLQGIQEAEQANLKLTNVLTCFPDQQTEVEPGKITPEAGQAALACLQRATDDLKAGVLDAIVTAPINKHNIQSEAFKFPGHTEYFANAFEVRDSLMFMVSETLRVGVVTGHVPLGRVRAGVNQDSLTRRLTQMLDSLKRDFGIVKPKIAVLGLNPHAGENGLLGQEEKEVIVPVMENFKKKGHLLFGPFSTDGFFAAGHYRQFDAVLAMYHDQGLTPFKLIAFDSGVNFSAGLPIVRTSPDHGTAYDIAGKGEADEHSMLTAIFTAIDIIKHRAQQPRVLEIFDKKTEAPERRPEENRRAEPRQNGAALDGRNGNQAGRLSQRIENPPEALPSAPEDLVAEAAPEPLVDAPEEDISPIDASQNDGFLTDASQTEAPRDASIRDTPLQESDSSSERIDSPAAGTSQS